MEKRNGVVFRAHRSAFPSPAPPIHGVDFSGEGGALAQAWWDKEAERVQGTNIVSEGMKDRQHSEADARQAAIAAREDLSMVVSHLSSANSQLAWIQYLLWAIVALLILIVLRGGH